MYRVVHGGRSEIVYVAGSASDRWAFWNGRVFRAGPLSTERIRRRAPRHDVAQSLTAPMPATVIKVLVEAGSRVRKGDTVVILEAMKMELPIRAAADAVVQAVLCKEGELVQPDSVLVELA
jgi:biotin carboxyl carrier protein